MKHLNILCASASLFLATSAIARDASADLSVSGSITPGAACALAVGGELSLGTINRGVLNPDPTQPTELSEQRVPVAVTCPQPTRFAFVVREAGGADTSQPLAFAMHAEGETRKPGDLFLLFDTQSTKIDGVQGYATVAEGVTDLEHSKWAGIPYNENLPITNGRYAVGFTDEAQTAKAPLNMKNLGVILLVRPRIVPVNELDLAADIAFSSDLGLEISYF